MITISTRKIQHVLFSVFVSVIFITPLLVFGSEHGGLVPCKGIDDCNFNHLIILVKNIINFLIIVAAPLAAIMFVYAGWLYMTAQGDSGKVSQAHDIFRTVFLGFIFILGAWLAVYTISKALLGDELQFLGDSSGSSEIRPTLGSGSPGQERSSSTGGDNQSGLRVVTPEELAAENAITKTATDSEIVGSECSVIKDKSTLLYEERSVKSANECIGFETYDGKNQVCCYGCNSADTCDALTKTVSETTFANNVLAKYDVLSGEVIQLVSGENSDYHQELWDLFSKIFPDNITDTYISKFVVFDDIKNPELAKVIPNFVDDDGTWTMYFNRDLFRYGIDKQEQQFTVVHELAHILTLNSVQVKVDALNKDKDQCKTYYDVVGCSMSQSYINTFFNRFWKGEKYTYIQNIESGEHDLYLQNPNDFINDYAATEPREDIAESFANFVFENKDETPNTQANQKIQFFYNYPELIQLRDDIRNILLIQ